MNILPGGGEIAAGMEIQEENQPSLTWKINPETNQLDGRTDGLTAVSQSVEAMLSVERFFWQIFTPAFGFETSGLIGQDSGYVASELQRRIEDALSVDDRVLGVESFSYTVSEEVLTADVIVSTVYGNTQAQVEVNLQ